MRYLTNPLVNFIFIFFMIFLIGSIIVICSTHYRGIDCKTTCEPNNVYACGWEIKCMDSVKIEQNPNNYHNFL